MSDWKRGDLAVGSFEGQRLHVRYGTSNIGRGWEIVEGGLFGVIPEDQLTDVEPVRQK